MTNTSSFSAAPLAFHFRKCARADRRVVLVDAEQREVEIVAREGEVVGIAAEERHLLLGREDEPDVGVLLVAVEPVLRALVERDDVGAQAGLVEAFLFDLRDRGPPRLERRLRIGGALSSRPRRAP